MAKYFLIESRSPFDSPEVEHNYQLASDLAKEGNEVSLFLVENGVFAARTTAQIKGLANLGGVNLLVDEFSLKERGITLEEVNNKIKLADMEIVVEAMATGQKVMWL